MDIDKPYCAKSGEEIGISLCYQPDLTLFWRIMAYLPECQALREIFIQSYMKIVFVTSQIFYSKM